MPRPRRPDPPVRLHITLPMSLFARLELVLHDPIRNKARYGERSAIIEGLVERWVADREQELQADNNSNNSEGA